MHSPNGHKWRRHRDNVPLRGLVVWAGAFTCLLGVAGLAAYSFASPSTSFKDLFTAFVSSSLGATAIAGSYLVIEQLGDKRYDEANNRLREAMMRFRSDPRIARARRMLEYEYDHVIPADSPGMLQGDHRNRDMSLARLLDERVHLSLQRDKGEAIDASLEPPPFWQERIQDIDDFLNELDYVLRLYQRGDVFEEDVLSTFHYWLSLCGLFSLRDHKPVETKGFLRYSELHRYIKHFGWAALSELLGRNDYRGRLSKEIDGWRVYTDRT